MPGFLTERVNNQVLDALFGGRAFVPPPVLFVGLSLTRAFKGGYVCEPNAPSYVRVAVLNDFDHFTVAELGRKVNTQAIRFDQPNEDWGLVVSVFVADRLVGGTVLGIADLLCPLLVEAGNRAPVIFRGGLHFGHC